MPINPIRVARSQENLSQTALAKKLGLSRPYIVRAEQACYVRPGTPLEHFVSRTLHIPPQDVISRYKAFQSSQRIYTTHEKFMKLDKLNSPELVRSEFDNKQIVFPHEIFREWREGYWATVTQFSIDMCVHPYSVSNYEDGNMYGMPDQLRDVLIETHLLGDNFPDDKRWYYAAA